MSLAGGGLLGTVVVVPAGVVVLPGMQGVAAVAEVPLVDVPLGRDGVAEATVELELPVPLLVVDVLGVVEAVLLGLVELELLGVVEVALVGVEVSVLVLLDGVHGTTVLVVPVWFCMLPPVTDPALPATPGVPCVTAGLPVELELG